MENVSPRTGSRETVFYADLSQTELDLTRVVASITTGSVYLVDVNPLTKTISFRLKSTTKGSKVVTFTSESNNAQVTVIYELPHLDAVRNTYSLINAKRPQWPYRTY